MLRGRSVAEAVFDFQDLEFSVDTGMEDDATYRQKRSNALLDATSIPVHLTYHDAAITQKNAAKTITASFENVPNNVPSFRELSSLSKTSGEIFHKYLNNFNFSSMTTELEHEKDARKGLFESWFSFDESVGTESWHPTIPVYTYLSSLQRAKTSEILGAATKRLMQLSRIAEEEGPDQLAMQKASLRGFLVFLQSNTRKLSGPSLVLTYDGNIRAEWKRHVNHRVAIEFLNEVDVRYVTFIPNRKHATRVNRSSGTSTVDTLFEDIGVASLKF